MGKPEKQQRPRFVTVKEAAELLVLSVKTVYRMHDKGELPGAKFGGAVRISRKGLEEYIARSVKAERQEDAKKQPAPADQLPRPRSRDRRRKARKQPQGFRCLPAD